jgi:hypothetical protein
MREPTTLSTRKSGKGRPAAARSASSPELAPPEARFCAQSGNVGWGVPVGVLVGITVGVGVFVGIGGGVFGGVLPPPPPQPGKPNIMKPTTNVARVLRAVCVC